MTALTFFRYFFMDKKPLVLPSTISFFCDSFDEFRKLGCIIKFHGLTRQNLARLRYANHAGTARFGRILEDLDAFAGNIFLIK